MATTFQVTSQRREVLPEKSLFSNACRQVGSVKTLAGCTPVLMLVIFSNNERFINEFDLLMFLGRFVCRLECVATCWTDFEFQFDGVVDLIESKRLAKVLWMSFLGTDFSASAFIFVWFGWCNDIGGGRFGGVG